MYTHGTNSPSPRGKKVKLRYGGIFFDKRTQLYSSEPPKTTPKSFYEKRIDNFVVSWNQI